MTEAIVLTIAACSGFAAGWIYSNKQNARQREYSKILANAFAREKRANAQYTGKARKLIKDAV